MHLSLIILTTSAAALANAQVVFNTSTDQFVCPSTPANGSYCTGPSLSSNIIIRCTGIVGQAGNCNDNLAGVAPIGVKEFAPCYETAPTAGDAACSYGGTVYPDNGPSFPVPGPGNNNNTTNTNITTTTTSAPLTATNNLTLPLSTSSSSSSSSSLPAPALTAYTALADLNAPPSARYPIPSASSNGTSTAAAAASGTIVGGSAPRKSAAFTGAAGRTGGPTGAALGAGLVAGAAAFGGTLLRL